MQTESDGEMTYSTIDTDTGSDELDRAHQEFLADIVHLDGKTVQRLFKAVAQENDDATPILSGDLQLSGSAPQR
jgi:hypothetical protein